MSFRSPGIITVISVQINSDAATLRKDEAHAEGDGMRNNLREHERFNVLCAIFELFAGNRGPESERERHKKRSK